MKFLNAVILHPKIINMAKAWLATECQVTCFAEGVSNMPPPSPQASFPRIYPFLKRTAIIIIIRTSRDDSSSEGKERPKDPASRLLLEAWHPSGGEGAHPSWHRIRTGSKNDAKSISWKLFCFLTAPGRGGRSGLS